MEKSLTNALDDSCSVSPNFVYQLDVSSDDVSAQEPDENNMLPGGVHTFRNLAPKVCQARLVCPVLEGHCCGDFGLKLEVSSLTRYITSL